MVERERFDVEFDVGGYTIKLFKGGEVVETFGVDGKIEFVTLIEHEDEVEIEAYVRYGADYDWETFFHTLG